MRLTRFSYAIIETGIKQRRECDGMIWFLLAALFVVYFTIVAVYTGIESKFHLVWLVLAVLATLFGVLADQNSKGMIHIPGFLIILFAIFWMFVLLLILRTVLQILKAGRKKPEENAEYMIVLGAHVNGTAISRALQNRLDAAFLYYLNNPNTKLILSGAKGPGEDISEAEAMQKYLMHRGVPVERLILEMNSYNTDENIGNSRKLVDLDQSSVIVVTNRFHLYRALCICRKQGMQTVQGLAAEDHPIMIPTYYLREVMAIFQYRRQKKI